MEREEEHRQGHAGQEGAEALNAEVLATVGHELRSPLTSIRGYTATLLRQERHLSRQERREFLLAIRDASERLQAIVDRFLEVSELEAGTISLRPTLVDVARLAWEALLNAEQRASQHLPDRFSFHLRLKDEHGVLSIVDARGRELIMSCGAALANLLVALRYFGFSWLMEMPSSTGESNLLARLTIEQGEQADEQERKLFFAIMQRRTNRHAFTERAVPIALLRRLEQVAGDAGTYLHVIWDEQQRANLANLVLNADQSLWADARFRHELAQWVHTNESNSPDGIPAYALGKADTTSYLGALPLRTLMEASEEEDETPQRTLKPPVLAVLSTVNDDWFDWLEAGLALENVLLHARLAGLWASFFSQPTEVPAQRQALRDLLGKSDFPQIVLRLGYASRVQPTPRRAVDDVLT